MASYTENAGGAPFASVAVPAFGGPGTAGAARGRNRRVDSRRAAPQERDRMFRRPIGPSPYKDIYGKPPGPLATADTARASRPGTAPVRAPLYPRQARHPTRYLREETP
ncbi:hypothetical protein GCM10010393_38160 [Streptomyces gobitricini]|uniref:Uncharacterized protein n=1 Tax=Streptomyces gobitricini TaxID=68211 RepID=A0ABP5ZRA0_9ACTN